jgi:ATP-binding cassette subfamily B protein
LSSKFFQSYVCVKQNDIKDCGAACLATICKHYGLKIPISKIREVAGTDKKGTSVLGIVRAAEKLGFTAKGVKAQESSLHDKIPLPAIAHVVIDGQLLHYVVIHRINKNEIVIADPAKGIEKYTLEQFCGIWTGVLILMVPTTSFKKGDETKSLFSRFLNLLMPQKGLILSLFLASMLYTFLGIMGAFYFQFLVDEILPYHLNKTLHIISVGVIVLYLFKVILNFFRTHLLLWLSQKLDIYLILGYYQHVINLPMKFFGTRQVGEIVSRLIDASKVREAVSTATLTILIDILMVFVGGAVLYSQNAFLFGITALLIPIYIIIVWAFHKPFEKINRKQMEENALLNSYIVESINGIETIKAYNAERKVQFETEKRFIRYLRSIFKEGLLNNSQNSIKLFIQLVGGVVILWIGANEVLKGNMTMGQLLTYNALLAYFLEPIQNLINLQETMQTAIVAADRLGEILDLELEKKEDEERKIKSDSLKGSIEFKDVSFRYGNRELTLKNINLHISPGEKVAFVGESGSGKTTIIKLLMKFYQCEQGEILIEDNNINDINTEYLREKIAYVPQNAFFFSGSIRENLTLGVDENIEMNKIVEAAKVSCAHNFINDLPLRYNSYLEENASNISGGQKQRLAIARAILKNPDILILDEATSNLDSVTEKAISQLINEFCEGISTIIIAHRLSTVMKCDRIYVIDKGEIVEWGSHEELLTLKGKYYNLWNHQFPSFDKNPMIFSK